MENRENAGGRSESHLAAGLPDLIDKTRQGEVFLRRLKRALLLRFYTDSLLSPSDRRLLDRVIFSTYCDCLSIGAAVEARRLLREARSGVGLFQRPLTPPGGKRTWSI